MWKRIAVATVAALAVLAAPTAPAHAEGPCEFSIPQAPSECLSQAMYEYVTGLQAENLASRTLVNTLTGETLRLRTEVWQAGADLTLARQALSVASYERDAAVAQLKRVNATVAELRAKVVVLKSRIKKLKEQLPFSAA